MTPFSELDEMIRMGWGETKRELIPEDWRTRKGPEKALPLEHRMAIRRARLLVTYNGESLPLKVWSERTGFGVCTLYSRIFLYAWDIERAFTEPLAANAYAKLNHPSRDSRGRGEVKSIREVVRGRYEKRKAYQRTKAAERRMLRKSRNAA
jgi:hypothetical protein